MSTKTSNLNEIVRLYATKYEITCLKTAVSTLKNVCYSGSSVTDAELASLLTTYAPLFHILDIKPLSIDDLPRSRGIICENIDKIASIEDDISSIQYMRITLAFNPSISFLQSLKSTIFNILGEYILFDIAHDPEIIGGIVLDYKGKHLNFGLDHLLDEYFNSHKDEILSAI